MHKENELIAEIYEKYGEHLEMLSDDEACGLVIRALAAETIKARGEAEWYKMAHKRCELMK